MTFTGGEQPSARPPQFPFEQAYHDIPNLAETMHFNGRVYDILGQMATTQAAQHGTEHFWQPARLVRAVVDSKVGGYERVGLLRAVTDYAVDAYTATPTTSQYGDVVSRLVDHGLLGKWVEQTYDPTTLEAQLPMRAAAAAERLHAHIGSRSLLVLPLCHGGLLPAIEGTAYYSRMAGRGASMYPIRYSRTKSFDRKPKVRPEELDYLRDAAENRTVVVYDDDTGTGRTVGRTLSYLAEKGVQGDGLVGIVNYDRRSVRRRSKQGNWFESF